MSSIVILWCVGVFLGIAALAIAMKPFRNGTAIIYGACLTLSLAVFVEALSTLLSGGEVSQVALPLGLPWVGAHFRIDSLSAFFLAIIHLGGAAASLYGIGYGRHEHEPQRVLPFFPAFLAGMTLVVLADDAFTFLFSWEFMSVASWALVLAHHREEGNVRAALVYIIMASFGTLALLLAFGLMIGADGHYVFAAIRAHPLPPALAGTALALALVGAGSKAGLVPFHVWLPLAHPAAPSHVSALMSGVMTKVAVYAFLRIAFDLLGPPAWWWGIPVLAVGGGSAVLGVLYALMKEDLKSVLACSTIENLGMIFVGLGLALAFEASDLPTASALALTAGLFHVFNHTLFKSVLFFGAGAVIVATGRRRMDDLGGLIHRMPVTAPLFLSACAAISALPPLNGFVSEWLIFQAILLSPQLPQWGLKLLVPAVGAMLALSTALAAACFVRVFGIVFLGRPRTAEARDAKEVDRWSGSAMMALIGFCFLAGILPGFVIDGMAPVIQPLTGAHMPTQHALQWLSIVPVAESRSSYNGLLVLVFIAASATLAAFVIHRLASRKARFAPSWDCGFPDPSPVTQYSAISFTQPIRRVFGTLLFHARERVEMPPPGDLAPARIRVTLQDPVWDGLYTPITQTVSSIARQLDRLQFLTIRHYLSFVFLALIFLLLVLALWP